MKASCWFLCLEKSATTFGEGCIFQLFLYITNVFEVVLDVTYLSLIYISDLYIWCNVYFWVDLKSGKWLSYTQFKEK